MNTKHLTPGMKTAISSTHWSQHAADAHGHDSGYVTHEKIHPRTRAALHARGLMQGHYYLTAEGAKVRAELTGEPVPHPLNDGTYYPNEETTRTLADARALYVGTERVSAVVEGGRVTLFHGLRVVFSGPIPEGVNTSGELHEWARTVTAETPADETPAQEATYAPGDSFTAPAKPRPYIAIVHAVLDLDQTGAPGFIEDTDGRTWVLAECTPVEVLAEGFAPAEVTIRYYRRFRSSGDIVVKCSEHGEIDRRPCTTHIESVYPTANAHARTSRENHLRDAHHQGV